MIGGASLSRRSARPSGTAASRMVGSVALRIPLEVEHLERLAVERAAQGEELLHEPDDLVALGVHGSPSR